MGYVNQISPRVYGRIDKLRVIFRVCVTGEKSEMFVRIERKHEENYEIFEDTIEVFEEQINSIVKFFSRLGGGLFEI